MSTEATRSLHVTEFGARSRRDLLPLDDLWRHRGLLYFLTWRDIKVRYKQTILGAGWAVFKPLIMMGIFTMVFGQRASAIGAGESQAGSYAIFVLCGLLPWLLFATGVTTASNSVVASERLVTKVYFPRIILPLASIGPSIVDFVISCGLLFIAIPFAVSTGFSLSMLLAPLPVLLTVLFTAAMGVATSGMSVKYRDLRHVFPFIIQVGMLATPVIYMRDATLSWSSWHMVINPMATFVTSFRAAIFGGPQPWDFLAFHGGLTVVALVLSAMYFRTIERNFADVI